MSEVRFSHAFDFGFEVKTTKPHDEVTAQELRAALLERINRISDQELTEVCSCFDSTTWIHPETARPSSEEMERWLVQHGFFVGERNPRANSDHAGKFMVIDTDTLSIMNKTELTFPDAGDLDGGWCLVGDDRAEIVWETYSFHCDEGAE